MYRVFRCFSFLIVFSLLTSCHFRPITKPNIILILVDQLNYTSLSCSDSGQNIAGAPPKEHPWEGISGIQMLCNDGIRYSHAYTPSTMSVSAIASILTASYPLDHGVHYNGGQFLSSRVNTVAEAALQKSYRTYFVSGGPPVFRKTGLNQGYEIFDDQVQISPKRFYRPAVENIKLALNFIDNEAAHQNFFTTIYLADLQFQDIPTTNALGEIRESSFQSQFENIDESIGFLIQQLKKKKIYDNTHIILAGLNTRNQQNLNDLWAVQLQHEATRVGLLVKPAKTFYKIKTPIHNTYYVNLVDVGQALFESLEATPLINILRRPDLKIVSIFKTLEENTENLFGDRILLSEMAWAKWRELGDIRFAARIKNLLYIYDSEDKIYDSAGEGLEDEYASLTPEQFTTINRLKNFFFKNNIKRWNNIEHFYLKKFFLAEELFKVHFLQRDSLKQLDDLSEKYKDLQMFGWRASYDLKQENWKDLSKISDYSHQIFWKFVAKRNLNEKSVFPDHACWHLLKFYNLNLHTNSRECRSDELLELTSWLDESLTISQRQKSMESFLKLKADHLLSERIAELNFIAGMSWDISLSELNEPSHSDLILSLPENRKYKQTTAKRLSE